MTNIDVEKLISEIDVLETLNGYENLASDTFINKDAVIDLIRKHVELIQTDHAGRPMTYWGGLAKEQPVSGGQPTPADETLSSIVSKLDAEVEGLHRRNRSTSGYIDPERGERMKALIDTLKQALSQPPKPAMSREELLMVINNARLEYVEIHGIGNFEANSENVFITALSEAGVLTIRGE